MEPKERISRLSEKFFSDIREVRRHLHQHPELSFAENQTSDFIALQLEKLGVSYRRGFVKTGIVATLGKSQPGKPCIALRADMDALPIEEKNAVPYRSVNQGVMHACGHDMHMSILLGCICILKEMEEELKGKIYFIFQPGEELLPGGAKLMLEENIFDDAQPMAVLGLHVLPSLESGKTGFRPGIYMASTDELYLTVKGKGGHGAMPQDIVDPVLIASHIVVALQQIISRKANPTMPSVLTIGKFIANGATNVVPDEVKMEGTFRTLDETWRASAHNMMKKMAENLAESMGGSCEFIIKKGYPVLKNDPSLTLKASELAAQYLGRQNVTELDIRMTSEDFAYFSERYPSVFFRLGVKNEDKHITSALHSATFDADENALQTGMGTMAYLAYSILRSMS